MTRRRLGGVLAPGAIYQFDPFTIEGFSDATPGDLCHEDLSLLSIGILPTFKTFGKFY
jgi:hypothetical protein